MLKLGVSEDKYQKLRKHMRELGIYEKDLAEKFVHAQGPGGQHVNKVATCVYLYHEPSNIKLKFNKYRSQALNRYWARRTLVDQVEKGKHDEELQMISEKEKVRRQKRKRTLAAKEQMLHDKHHKSEVKKTRRKLHDHEVDLDA